MRLDIKASKLEKDKATLSADPAYRALAGKSPSEVAAWVNSNTATLPQMRETVKMLAAAVVILLEAGKQ